MTTTAATHRVLFGTQNITGGAHVDQRRIVRRAIELADAELTDNPAEVEADIAAAERMLTLPVQPGHDGIGYVVVDDDTFERVQRLIADAAEYASVNDYGDDEDAEPVDRLLGSADSIITRLWEV